MTQKPKIFRKKGHKPYWGVLARETPLRAFYKPDHFISLLQAQYQTARITGKDKPNQSSEDMTA